MSTEYSARASPDDPPNRVSDGAVDGGANGVPQRSTHATGPSTDGSRVSLPHQIAAR
jgi:hypothetical protein